MSTNFMQTKSLIEARIIKIYDITYTFFSIIITIQLPTKLIILHPSNSSRRVRNKKKLRLGWILWMAKNLGCIVTEQKKNRELLIDSLYTVYLEREDLEKMIRYDQMILTEVLDYANNRENKRGDDGK